VTDALPRLLEKLAMQRYSQERLAILQRCSVEYDDQAHKLVITCGRQDALFHSHILVCDVGHETRMPVELRVT
jgi:hypothetical protein